MKNKRQQENVALFCFELTKSVISLSFSLAIETKKNIPAVYLTYLIKT